MLELSDPEHEWTEKIEFGTLRGSVDPTVLPEAMLAWIVQEPNGLTAARVGLNEGGSLDASVPTGPGRLHYATPETAEDPPPAWPTLGEAEVQAGEVAKLITGS